MRRLFHRLRPGASDRPPGAATASQANRRSRVNANSISATQPATTLHDAATKGWTETVARLLDQGVAVDHFNAERATPLHLAIKEGHVDIVRILLSGGASVEAPYGPLLIKPLHLAAITLNPAMMEAVLRHKPNLESRHNGLTALFLAVFTGDVAVVTLLLDAGADIYARTTSESGTGESVLHMACASFKTAMVAYLIRRGADVNVAGTNPKGQTALHIAAEYGNAEAVTELIAAGANMYAKFPDKRTALEVAAQNGRIKTVEAFMKHGMDPLAYFDGRENAILTAVVHGQTDMSRWFVDRYADCMDHNTKMNLVIGAAGANRIKILEMLDGKGFPMLGYDDRGVGPLFVALHFQHKDAIVFLLRRGVDFEPHIPKDANSWVAKDPNYQPGLELLRSAKSQLQAQPDAKLLFPEWQFKDPEWDSNSFQAQTMAVMASVNATRKIQANQEPAGIFTCRLCHDLDFRRGMDRDAEIVYFVGMGSLEFAASQCNGCHFLRDCLEAVRKGYGERVWAAMSSQYLALYSAAEGAPLLAHFYNGNPGLTPSRRIEIYVNEGRGPRWPTVGTARDVFVQRWGESRVRVAKDFLAECSTNHPDCQYALGKLPTRVIRIPSSGEPHLYISKGERAKYIALSHCWGGVSPLTTTTSTLSQRLHEISFSSLPKTFQDALTITRSLDVEYLWIDSLCIIQDDGDDWAREAARMKAVYADCYAMISASDSTNPHGGCFGGAGVDQKNRSFEVHSKGPCLSRVTAFVRLTQLRDSFHAEVGHRIGEAAEAAVATAAGDSQSRTILNQRGWCFQERVLAPRILHFGPSELAWECPETVACECQCVITGHDRESRFKAVFADRILRDKKRQDSQLLIDVDAATAPCEQVDILVWMHFVEEFTRRDLTRSTDTLHAISGLAEFMGAVAHTDYLCGLWKKNLAEFLLWQVEVPRRSWENLTNLPLHAPQPFRITAAGQQGNTPRAKRHAVYHAPSWSWASVIAPIRFHIGRLDRIKADQISHVPKDGMLAATRARESLLESVDAQCFLDPLNRYGPPKGPASLTIRAPTVFAVWPGERDASDPLRDYTSEQILTLDGAGAASSESSSFTADFHPDPFEKETLGICFGDKFLLLATILDNDAVVPHRSNKAISGKTKATVTGIVLAFGPAFAQSGCGAGGAGERPVCQRVGLFSVAAEDWRQVERTRTVVII